MQAKILSQATRQQASSLPKNGTVTVQTLVQAHAEEMLATLLMLVSIPGLLPSTGIPLGSLFSPAMAIVGFAWFMRRKSVRLPSKLNNYQLKTDVARKILNMMAKSYEYAEKLCKPRQQKLTKGAFIRVVGAAVMLNAFIVFLPIPFGNTLPAFANIVLALGILFKDGLAVVAGLALTLSSLIIGSILGVAAFWAVQKLV
ncbi:MAG: exopolysaccharide biosynthesis protein [Alphaproteobacteria bacterium]|nr:MAG: exopolysaccharide biosynthesis protein [Alphaproteobacteria bacterium]